ncbi:MAG: Strongly-conserved Zn-finger binding protein (TFIIIA) [Peltula sp. TS41687]|nr:MAG: Strongly-conserved Zn-finger binding protein (TFIIIA) [Peltula sp. TS41687]
MKRKQSEALIGKTKLSRRTELLSPDISDAEQEDGHRGLELLHCEDEVEITQSKPITPLTPSSLISQKPPSEQKTHHCTYEGCGKSFNRPARLAEHLRSHTNERIFKCSHEGCDKDFLRATHLNHHVKSAHEDIRDYICELAGCGKKFLTNTRLKRHQAAHEGRDRFRCSEYPPCEEVFRKHATLQRHITSVHLNQKPFPCTHADEETAEQCTRGFDTAAQLRKHQGREHGGLRFWCSECTTSDNGDGSSASANPSNESPQGQGFATYSLLQAHIRTAHPPTCIYCSQPCNSQRDLRQHIEIHHSESTLSDRRTHLCDYAGCDRGFTKLYNLTLHKRTVHEGEKAFLCSGETDLSNSKKTEGWTGVDACGRAFQTKGNLEEHIRTQHLGLPGSRKPKPSRKTSRPTTQPTSVIGKLTGLDEDYVSAREIICLFSSPDGSCAYRFTRDYDLRVHLRVKHGLMEDEIESALMEREALSGGVFWTGGSGWVEGDDDEEEDEEMEAGDDAEEGAERMMMDWDPGNGKFYIDTDINMGMEMEMEMGMGNETAPTGEAQVDEPYWISRGTGAGIGPGTSCYS